MNDIAKCRPQSNAVPDDRIKLSKRLLIYLAIWLLAALAFQVFLQPEGVTETHLTPIQQRCSWPFYTPLMAVIGLAQAVTWPEFPGATAGLAAAACFVLHGILALSCTRRSWIIALAFAQALLLTVSVIYFVRQFQLPSGG